ncbi:MAG: ammonium transporter [Proteobacteria bacterium]|nr:ammonium transporter [Pseudomonadota bacterium]
MFFVSPSRAVLNTSGDAVSSEANKTHRRVTAVKKNPVPLLLLTVICVIAFLAPAGTASNAGPALNAGDTAWMLASSALVLFMTPGLSFFYGGMVRSRNVISTMLQSYVCMGLMSLLWVVVGFSLSFGDSIGGLIGNPATYFMFKGVTGATETRLAPTIPFLLFALFQLKFAVITPALITGAFAERVKFKSYLIFITLFLVCIYAPLAHWTWHPDGFLRKWGVLDFAGGTVVHMSAGFAALAGALFLGRRKDHSPEPHSPAKLQYIILGTGMLWFGWFGFNAGSALAANDLAALAFGTTNTASASAAIAWIFYDLALGRKPTAMGFCIGAVVGLVAVTPAAGFVSIGASVVIGALSSVVSRIVVDLKTKTSIDDTLDVFPCHGVGGLMGMVLTGVFAKEVGLVNGPTATFYKHLAAMVLVGAFSFCGAYILYKLTDIISPLRVSAEDEEIGLDMSQHLESIDNATGSVSQVPQNAVGKTALSFL